MLGIRPEVLALADRAITIPMLGMANSLSVVSAYAIVAHEAATRLSLRLEAGSARQQIRRLRQRRGWTLRDCGQRTGVSSPQSPTSRMAEAPRRSKPLQKLNQALVEWGITLAYPAGGGIGDFRLVAARSVAAMNAATSPLQRSSRARTSPCLEGKRASYPYGRWQLSMIAENWLRRG